MKNKILHNNKMRFYIEVFIKNSKLVQEISIVKLTDLMLTSESW